MIKLGRHTFAAQTEPITVFMIGMRANRWWKVRKVSWTASRMPKMLAELAHPPDEGLL